MTADTVDPLYLLDIEDGGVDLRARIFRECEAMAAYMASRGFPASETIKDRLGVLDVGIARRHEIPMADLFALHGTLSEVIKPAIPRTVELLHWDAHANRQWHWLAPVGAIRRLLVATLVALVLFFVSVAFPQVRAETIAAGLFPETAVRWQIPLVTLFLGSLAALGACFSVLYDARKYVVEGTYDPRVGSNYAIRIILGVVAGLLLAQILADPTIGPAEEQAGTRAVGVPMLALLGGFASQLVYTLLNKLVDAAGSVFEQERAAEVRARERAIIVESQEKTGRETVQRAAATIEITSQLQAATTPEERQALLDRLIRTAAGITPEAEARMAADLPGLPTLEKAAAAVAFGRAVLDLLPQERAGEARAALASFAERIDQARALAQSARSGDLVRIARQIAEELAQASPLRAALAASLGALRAPLSALGLSPLGLALTLAQTTARHGSAAYLRWKTRILDSDYVPDLLAPEDVDAAAVREAMGKSFAFEAAFAAELDDMAALNDIGRQAAREDEDALFARWGARFASRSDFEAALAEFRRALLDRPVRRELPPDAVEQAGAKDAATLLRAIDALRADPAARGEIERIFLMAAATREGGEAGALEVLLEAIETAGGRDGP